MLVEFTLHRELKSLYSDDRAAIEVRLGQHRIDVLDDERLVEIQVSPLGALRDKIRVLADAHRMLIVKPIAYRKYIVHVENGRPVRRRLSPKRGEIWDLFAEMVHAAREFGHPNVALEVVLTEEEEWRRERRGRRRWRRRPYRIEDRRLLEVVQTHRLADGADFRALLPADLARPFTTADLGLALDRPKWLARMVTYSMRHMGALAAVGKKGNHILYDWPTPARSRRRSRTTCANAQA